jgi:hypothetical protein
MSSFNLNRVEEIFFENLIHIDCLVFSVSLLNLHDDERQKPENWIVIGWLPIYDESKAKHLRPQKGYDSISARKYRLYHDCWKPIFRNWNEKTKFTRAIVWADSERRQTKLFIGVFIADQQVYIICSKRLEEV